MRQISPGKAGVAVGTVISLWHVAWVSLVAVGRAKPVLDFVLGLHFIKLDYSLSPYATATAGELIILTFVIGAIFGVVFAIIWNWLTFDTAPAWEKDSADVTAIPLRH